MVIEHFFFQAEDGIRDKLVTGVQTCALPIFDDDVFWRKDGTSFPVEYWSHPLIRDGKTVGAVVTFFRSEERRVGKECRSRSWRNHSKKNSIIGPRWRDALPMITRTSTELSTP